MPVSVPVPACVLFIYVCLSVHRNDQVGNRNIFLTLFALCNKTLYCLLFNHTFLYCLLSLSFDIHLTANIHSGID